MVAYKFEDGRGTRSVACYLSGFNRILQVDGQAAYTSLMKEQVKAGSHETITPAGYWAHVQRKFYELHDGGINQTATASVKAMAKLWQVEDEIRGENAETRALVRQQKSIAVVADLFNSARGDWRRCPASPRPQKQSATQ
ncbi:transposase [Agrobacterium vaccinii]|nr:IS66 family transposase [Agrobacterium vaccinii]UHS63929.1 transposase [Agrobacterium vaccinii]